MNDVRHSLIWSFLQNYSSALIQFISSMVLSRLLTPTDIGIYSICAVIVAIAHVMRDLGVGEYLIQEKELSKERVKTALGLTLLMGVIAFFILNSISSFVANFYHADELKLVIAVLSINFIILPFCTPVHALLVREMKFKPIFIIQTVSALVGSIVSIILALNQFGYISLAWSSVISSLVILFLSTLWRPVAAWTLPGISEWRRILAYSAFATGNNIINLINNRFQEFVIGRMMGFHSLGIINRGSSLLDAFNQALIPAISRVAFPFFSENYRRSSNSINKDFSKIISIVSVVSLPSFSLIAVLAFPLTRLLFGSQWDESVELVQIIFLGYIFYSIWVFIPMVLKVTGHVKQTFFISSLSMLIYIPIIISLSFLSLKAVATGIVINHLMRLFFYIEYLRKAINFGWLDLIQALKKSFFVTFFTCLFPVFLINLNIIKLDTTVFTLLVSGAIALPCWIAMVFVVDHPIVEYLSSTFRLIYKRF